MSTSLSYSDQDRTKLVKHYDDLKDKASYDAFVLSAHELLQRIGADSYHVRMALTRGKSLMEFGSRAAYRHSEGVGGIRVGLLMMEADVPLVPQRLNPNVRHFDPRGETAIVKFTVPTWADIPPELLALNEKAMRWEYERIKDTKLVEIRRGSGSDNEALKYAVVHGVRVDELPNTAPVMEVNAQHEERFKQVIAAVGVDDMGYFLGKAEEVLELLGVEPGDQRVTYSCPNPSGVALTVGQRYCLEVKEDQTERFGFIVQEKGREPDVKYGQFDGDGVFFSHTSNRARVEVNDEPWKVACSAELQRTRTSGFRQHSNTAFERAVFDHDYRAKLLREPIGLVMVNITWNSRDWKEPSVDKSNHDYVKEGNTPHESWNFDLDNPRNTEDRVFGYAHFAPGPPKLEGRNNLIIFYSAGEVVGFYGKGEILRGDERNAHGGYTVNLSGEKSLSMVLENKLKAAKAKGYLEDKQRMGHIGFIYLERHETALAMIDEAIIYNPDVREKLIALRDWVEGRIEKEQATNTTDKMSIPLNRIFYGPPGTGKTYHTIGAAVQVCDPVYYAANKDDDVVLRKRFNALLIKDWQGAEGRIAFCTFHQSYSYEDFVEGIKPLKPKEGETFLKYDVRPGILKQMARRASYHASGEAAKVKTKVSFTPDQFDKAEFYKISLGDSQNPEDQLIYEYCIKNNVIAIGFLDQHDLTGKTEQEVKAMERRPDQSSYSHTAMNFFIHYLRDGDYVVITNGLYSVRAIGKVTGGYTYKPDSPIGYPHFRSVEWMVINEDIPYQEIYNKQFSQQTIYKLKKEDVKRDFFVQASTRKEDASEVMRFVLIIDEINRGNVAGIFGELITLIEENKRKGKPEALEVTLPYSQEPFSIPDNLYIIGTMNTADRSVEALDAALRRRFSFVPMMPEPDKLNAPQGLRVNLPKLLKAINLRLVQLLDEDHQIGHSHLWDIHGKADPLDELKRAFKDKIIPQLEEYFHRDRAKLRLVLGASFVESVESNDDIFLGDVTTEAPNIRPIYKVTPVATWDERAFRSLYEKA